MVDELTLYCNCFPGHQPNHHQYNQKNLLCGSATLSTTEKQYYKNRGFVLDDENENNISHLNNYFGDLTGLYHIWKNTNHEFVGTNQYRRFWDEKRITSLNKNVLYVSEPYNFDKNIAEQFIEGHGVNGLHVLTSAVLRKRINMTEETLLKMNQTTQVSSCNMFFAHNELFNKVCDTLFAIIFELYEGCKYALDFIQKEKQTRMLAYLSERILTLLYIEKEYYFGNIQLVTVPWVYKYND